MTADAPMRQLRADARRAGRSMACGPIVVPSPICARGWTIAGRIDLGPVRHEAEQQLGFGDDLIADDTPRPARAPATSRRRPSETSSRSRSPGTTWRRNLASFTPRR